jgi:hypothetical protein
LEHVEHPRGVFLAENDVDARVFGGEATKHGREVEGCQPVDGTDPNDAPLDADELLEFGAGRFEFVESAAGPLSEYFSGGGEGTTGTVDEVEADLLFESTELLGDGRLCDMEFFGGTGEMAVSSNGEQVLELSKFHDVDSTCLLDLDG